MQPNQPSPQPVVSPSPHCEVAPDVRPTAYPYSVIIRPEDGRPPFRLSANRPLEECAADFIRDYLRSRAATVAIST